MDNIKEYVVIYKPNRIPIVSGLEQWDFGQYLVIEDIPLDLLEDEKEIHFCFPNSLKSVVVEAEYEDNVLKAQIPKFIFQKQIESCLYSSYKAYAFVYLKTNEYGRTIYRIALEIEVRPKPDDYEYEEEQLYFEELTEVLDGKADNIRYSGNILYLLAGNNVLSRVTIKSSSNSGTGTGTDGREIELRNNGTYIQWRYVGDETWINLISLEALKGDKGDKGEKGDNGITPSIGENGNWFLGEEDTNIKAQGTDGRGIKSIEKTATNENIDTYTITFTDDEKFEYTVTNAVQSSGESFSGKAEDVSYDDEETQLGADNVQDAVGKLSQTVNDLKENGTGTIVSSVEPMEDDIPKVFIIGVKPTTKDDVLAEMEYISKTDNFHAYLKIKCQGNSSMSYDKKNFTVKLYSDEARETKLKKKFKGWNHSSNKFVLKANFIDHSHARNIVSARLWSEVVKSRPDYASLPEEMRNSPNNGAVDGFPIKVYYNGTYEGVYTWNIGKDDWQWGMDEDNPNHVLLCAETSTDGGYFATPCNFRALWSGVDGSNWSVEVGTNSDAVKTSLNNLIQFVMDNDGDDFRNGISNYLDVQSAIDYYVFQYEICGIDGLSKNMLLATYDGTLWICGAYDMDSTYGLVASGSKIMDATTRCPEDYYERYSLLWERFETNYVNELKARQAELRKTVLTYSNMVNHFERFMDIIGLDLYKEDLTIYPDIPSGTTNNIQQLRNFIRDRQSYVDGEFAAMTEPVRCTGITLSAESLVFGAEGTQTLTATVTPDGCTDAVTWESNNTSVAIVDEGVVTAIANGSATITAKCGEYSASCVVSVSGIAEAIPCTGITLDKTELTFTEEGTQTIVATVTPSDTTDKIVWVSGNESVVTVENGVVTAVGDGTANITATCGNYSATCVVSVEIPVSPILYRATDIDTSAANVDTGVKLLENDIDFTVIYKAKLISSPSGDQILFSEGTSGYIFNVRFRNAIRLRCNYCSTDNVDITIKAPAVNDTVVVVATHTADSGICDIYARIGNDATIHEYSTQIANVYYESQGATYVRTNTCVSTVDEFAIYNYAMEKDEIVETVFGYSEQLVNTVAWSEKDDCSISSGAITSGKRYVTNDAIAIPDGAVAARLNNVNGSVFTWHGIAQYDADMAFISYAEGDDYTVDIAVILANNAKYVRFSAQPSDTVTPATGLEASFLFETAE